MKMSPGMTMRAENPKNHHFLPTTSTTCPHLAPGRSPRRRDDEVLLAHAVQARLAGPRLMDDHAQDRAAHRDRREHRREHADDEDEGEAADDRRPEVEQ